MRRSPFLLSIAACCVLASTARAARADVVVDDFEDVSDWTGVSPESTIVHDGHGAGRWDDHVHRPSIKKLFPVPIDVSSQKHLQAWLYSAVANDADVQIVLDSENAVDTAGWDYYAPRIHIDWTGWRLVRIALDDFSVSRNPLGWNHINYVSLV
jgi:hypothetical protein